MTRVSVVAQPKKQILKLFCPHCDADVWHRWYTCSVPWTEIPTERDLLHCPACKRSSYSEDCDVYAGPEEESHEHTKTRR